MNNTLTYAGIRVDSPYPIQQITELTITGRLNEHTRIELRGVLLEEDRDRCVAASSVSDNIRIYDIGGDIGETLMFSGVVTQICVRHERGVYHVDIEGMSHTCLMDTKLRNRSFQDKGDSYSSVIGQVVSGYENADFILTPQDHPTGSLIVQYGETDWTFLKRLASHFNTVLVPQALGSSPRFWLGIRKMEEKEIEDIVRLIATNDAKAYHKAIGGGLSVSEFDFIKYEVESETRLALGVRVTFKGRPCIVEMAEASFTSGLFKYKYLLGSEAGTVQTMLRNEQLCGLSLLGSVLDVRGSEVKIHLRIDEYQNTQKACWIPYAAQSNNVFYCMPEKGESISLYFPLSSEPTAIAVNAVRRNGSNCSGTSKTDTKRVAIPTGQELKLGVPDIDIIEDASLYIKMDKNDGIMVQSHDNLGIFSLGKLRMEARESIKVMANSGNLVAGSGDNASKSQLYMLGCIGGDTNLCAAMALRQDGRFREPFPDMLNRAIEYTVQPPFSWWKLVLCVVAAVAVVALVVVTAGAAAVALGVAAATVNAIMLGAAISGGIAIVSMAAKDIISGKNSSVMDYMSGAFRAAVEGAVCGAVASALAPLQGMQFLTKLGPAGKLFAKACINGLTSTVTDAVLQIPSMFNGEGYDWKRGLISFGTGFAMTYVGAGINALVKKITGSPNSGLCNLSRDPVDMVNGNMVTDTVDFELPGPIPLVWRRTWYSDSSLIGHLGHGSRCSFEMGLDVFEDGQIGVYLADGRAAVFPQMLPGGECFNYKESMLLRHEIDHYVLFDPATRLSYLLYPSENGYMRYKMRCIRNAQGNEISLDYDSRGYLRWITDSVGRKLDVTTDEAGHIVQVAIGNRALLRYRYNEVQDLTEVIDAAGLSLRIEYRNHLVMSKTDRNGNSFNWKYDGSETGSRVTETWGNGLVLYGKIEYHDGANYNVLTDSLGNTTEYHYDERKLCTKIVYADHTETRREYNERYELISEIDEEGRPTSYSYGSMSQRTGITRADGSKIAFEYDDVGRLISTTDPEGGTRHRVYNDDDTINISIDETGAETTYGYNAKKQVESVTNAKGDTIRLEYDSHENMTRATLPDGASARWEYDGFGNCVSVTNALGAVSTYGYDDMSRLVRASLADGNEIHLQYNGYNDVVNVRDRHTEVKFEYTALGSLHSRIQGGRKVTFEYDTEERLETITNENGETYEFERDIKGNITKETGYDSVTRTYGRDLSGLVLEIDRPIDRWTRYQHDKLGNVIRADYYDGTWDTFGYDKTGRISEAANGDTTLKFERDKAGRVTKEWQNGEWVSSEYDELGNRTQVSSSLDASILTDRDQRGWAKNVAAAQRGQPAWAATARYNELGQEIERMLPGVVVGRWQYDATGKPTSHQVRSGDRDTRRRSYEWGAGDRLKTVTDGSTRTKLTYGYDEYGSLVSSTANNKNILRYLYRASDDAGNIYETEDKSDRIYGAGSRLEKSKVDTKELRNVFQGGKDSLVTKGTEFEYDAEGNLIRKTEAGGNVWQYEYYGNGMLSKVTCPDGSEVTFKYDSLGRRIEKKTPEKTIKFVWDRNNPLHELENGGIITWVFGDGFVPVAKLTDIGNYSIVTDHIGTPAEVYGDDGERIWSVELDIYGCVKGSIGDVDFVPFRYQGQYADQETGLYYNRFRYYSPIEGCYIQQDPIGLAGGNPTQYAYVGNPNWWIDPLGLAGVDDPGYFVYGLFKDGADTPYYIGITDDTARRSAEHIASGRLTDGVMNTLEDNVLYGQARGYEQAYIEHYGTRTGTIGEAISPTNQGNKVNSFDHSRTDSRAQVFEETYNSKSNQLKNGNNSSGVSCK